MIFTDRGVLLCLAAGLLVVSGGCSTPPQPVLQEVRNYYPDSDRLESRFLRQVAPDGQSVLHGAFEEHWPDGSLRRSGVWVHGVPAGLWVHAQPGGQVRMQGEYVDGLRSGDWSHWSAEGVLVERCGWHLGKRHGAFERFDEQGRRIAVGQFVRGNPEGEWSLYHANGARQLAGRYVQGQAEGRWTLWSAEGSLAGEGTYRKGAREGLFVRFAEDGEVVARLRFKRDRSSQQFLPDPGQFSAESVYGEGEALPFDFEGRVSALFVEPAPPLPPGAELAHAGR